MRNYIYCATTAKDEQSFYLMMQGKKYFLFTQAFRRSNKEVFEQGISLSTFRKLKKHCSFSVRHTIQKLPAYIHYIEQEYDIIVLSDEKSNHLKMKDRRIKYNKLSKEVA